MTTTQTSLPAWLSEIEGYVYQYYELQALEKDLAPILRVPSTEETVTHMAVRLAAEREIRGRMDYLENFITLAVVRQFDDLGKLPKSPESHTSCNER